MHKLQIMYNDVLLRIYVKWYLFFEMIFNYAV